MHLATKDLEITAKTYLWTVSDHGAEFGYGPAGLYAAHAHRKVVDVVFAHDGLEVAGVGAHLAVALPNTTFGPVETADFWFLKFFPTACDPSMPDKIDIAPGEPAGARGLILASDRASYELDLFDPRIGKAVPIKLTLSHRILTVRCPSFGRLVLE